MEIVDFYPKTFHQIDKQYNPAFGDKECLMIVRECPPVENSYRAEVLHIVPDPIESVNKVAVFWKHYRAIWYCNRFQNNDESVGTPQDLTFATRKLFEVQAEAQVCDETSDIAEYKRVQEYILDIVTEALEALKKH